MSRQATVLIADEMYFNLHGKAILQGIYPGDLSILSDPSTAPQLLFYFIIQTDITEPFKSLAVEVTIPGSAPVQNTVFMPPHQLFVALAQTQPERTTITVKHPMLIARPILKAGRIEMKVIHDAGEILVAPQWITLTPTAAPKTN